ncbi:hypothetical protein BGZ73_007870 [Actinomortierella ambigua]|nr:hypothetical protein BGZ73_007870 [Actinomortierella ambigua]
MGEPRTPPNEPILESMGDDGISPPPALIHAPQPHYYNTVNGPLGYHAQHGPVPSWPNHGYATISAPPAGHGTVESHRGHALPHPQQQQQQGYYPQHSQHQWPQDQYQQQQPYQEYIQQQNIATAAAHGYQLVSSAPVTHPAPVPMTAMPSSVGPNPHHASTSQMIPPIPPVNIPQYASYFPPKTELDPASEEIDRHPSPPKPIPATTTQPQEQRQRPPSPRITIPASRPPAPAAAPLSSQSSPRSSARITTPSTSTSQASGSSFTQERVSSQNGSSTPSPRSSTPTSGISKLGERLASFSSNKTSTSTTSRLAEISNLGSVRAMTAKLNSAVAKGAESPVVSVSGAVAKSLPVASDVPRASSPSVTTPTTADTPKDPPVSPQESMPLDAKPLETSVPKDLAQPSKPASTTSLSSTAVITLTEVAVPTTAIPPTAATTADAGSTSTSRPVSKTATAVPTPLDSGKVGLGTRLDTTKVLPAPEKETITKRPISSAGPPAPPVRGGTYDWRTLWAERRKSVPVSPYSPSFNALRKLNVDKELPPIRTGDGRQQQQQQKEQTQDQQLLSQSMPKLDPFGRPMTPSIDATSSPTSIPASSSVTAIAAATTVGSASARVSTPPLDPATQSAGSTSRTATPRINTPSPPPSSSPSLSSGSPRAATPPASTVTTATTPLRVPTPPAQAPPSGVAEAPALVLKSSQGSGQPWEERRAFNLSDYVYYDHDHDSKCIVESTDAYPETTTTTTTTAVPSMPITAAMADDGGKVPLEHANSQQQEKKHRNGNSSNTVKQHQHQHHQKLTQAESNFICAGCEEPISGMMVTAMGKRWHVDHFICVECGQNLEHVQFFQRDGHPYCHYDYHEKFSARCAHCDTAIENECLTALGKTWHPEHFFCRSCGDPFGEDGYMIHEDRPYCEKDYLRLFAPKCAGCQDAIQGDFINALKRKWHRDCFGCTVCHIGFDNSSYFVLDGEPYCETHYKATKAKAAA